jgi:hypothetical protein
MSGIFYIGLGDRFDSDNVQAYPPGSVIAESSLKTVHI